MLLMDDNCERVLQAYVEECRAKISELQTAQGREASSSQAAKAQLQEERANWRGEVGICRQSHQMTPFPQSLKHLICMLMWLQSFR